MGSVRNELYGARAHTRNHNGRLGRRYLFSGNRAPVRATELALNSVAPTGTCRRPPTNPGLALLALGTLPRPRRDKRPQYPDVVVSLARVRYQASSHARALRVIGCVHLVHGAIIPDVAKIDVPRDNVIQLET